MLALARGCGAGPCRRVWCWPLPDGAVLALAGRAHCWPLLEGRSAGLVHSLSFHAQSQAPIHASCTHSTTASGFAAQAASSTVQTQTLMGSNHGAQTSPTATPSPARAPSWTQRRCTLPVVLQRCAGWGGLRVIPTPRARCGGLCVCMFVCVHVCVCVCVCSQGEPCKQAPYRLESALLHANGSNPRQPCQIPSGPEGRRGHRGCLRCWHNVNEPQA